MASKSGSTQALLLSAIRYFGLVSENGLPTPDLEALVQSNGKQRQEVWQKILVRAYPNLFKLDLQRATTQQLTEALAREGLSNQETIRKALNFFSIAAKDAGLTLSPHIKPYAGRRHTIRRARAAVEEQQDGIILPTPDPNDRNGSTDLEILLSKFPDFDLSWTNDQMKKWLEGIKQVTEFCSDKRHASNTEES